MVGDGRSIVSEIGDWESSGPTYTFNELRDNLCGEAKLCFNANHIYLFGLTFTGRESKKLLDHVELEGIEFHRHPIGPDARLEIDINAEAFYFQKSLNIDAINKETKCIDRKAHVFWEIPVIDAKSNG